MNCVYLFLFGHRFFSLIYDMCKIKLNVSVCGFISTSFDFFILMYVYFDFSFIYSFLCLSSLLSIHLFIY